MKTKVLTIQLPAPEDISWTETFDNIAKARTSYYAGKLNLRPESEEYKHLLEFSRREDEVINWAVGNVLRQFSNAEMNSITDLSHPLHRMIAPEPIRRNWTRAKITVRDANASEISAGPTSTPTNPRLAPLEAENARLRAELAKLVKPSAAAV